MATIKNVDTAWTPITARQRIEMLRLSQVKGSHVNKDSFQLYLEGKNPFVKSWIEKDGRIYFEVTTLGLTAEEWITRLKANGHKISNWAKDVLSKPDYDLNHRYEADKTLKVILIRGKEIKKDSERLTKNLKAIAVKDFGTNSVSELKGELELLIRKKFSNKELEEMVLYYIVVLHEPIVDSGGHPRVLFSFRGGGESWVDANGDDGSDRWRDSGAFAFLQVSA